MAYSMTAYGRAVGENNGKNYIVEIKSVNNRFFDCTIKIPSIYGYLEEKIKSYLQNNGISRGKLNVYVNIEALQNDLTEIILDDVYTSKYIEILRDLCEKFNLTDDITVMKIAANRDIFKFQKPVEDIEKDWEDLLPFLKEATDNFMKMRQNEGENLRLDLCKKMDLIKDNIDFIKAHADDAQEAYRVRLETKLKATIENMNIELDSARILTECAIFAEKTAIDEELVRLSSHFQAFYQTISSEDAVGRKLDFLFQEVNREINTIGSKINDINITKTVLQIKNTLEKIREQIQNLE